MKIEAKPLTISVYGRARVHVLCPCCGSSVPIIVGAGEDEPADVEFPAPDIQAERSPVRCWDGEMVTKHWPASRS